MTQLNEKINDSDQPSMIEQILRRESSANSTSSSLVASACSAIGATRADLREAVLQVLTKANEEMGQRFLTGHAKMVHDFAALLEDYMQDIPEQPWHSFQIECLNFEQSYRQGNEQPTTQHQPTLQWEHSCFSLALKARHGRLTK